MFKPINISFDFDCTLGEEIIQRMCKVMQASATPFNIFIITSRNEGESYNRDLYGVAERMKIPFKNIYFTEGAWKWKKIKELEIDLHYDDVPEECELIAINTNCTPLLLWDEYCKGSIKVDDFGQGKY